VITGGHAGSGHTAAIEFATQGAPVVVSACREKEGLDVIAELNALGGKAIFITTEVSHGREVKAMIERTLATFDQLDGTFNNAGITPTRIHIGATVKLEKVGEGFSITTIEPLSPSVDTGEP